MCGVSAFKGNLKTADDVLRREMRQMESAPASAAAIEQSRVRLERLGFFSRATVETPEVPGHDDLIDVEYTVEEQSSGSIGASFGFAQDAGLILGLNLQQDNFMGSGKRIGIGLNSSKYQDVYNFSYTNPYYTEDGVSRGFNIFYRSTDLEEVNIASYSTDTLGGAINFGYPIAETQRLGFSFGVSNTDITTGRFAVQEIRASPRLETGVDNWYESTFDPDTGTYTGVEELQPIYPIGPNGLPISYLSIPDEPGFMDLNGNEFLNWTVTPSWSQSTLNRGRMATRGASQSLALEVSAPRYLTWSSTSSPTVARSTTRYRCSVAGPCACAPNWALAMAMATPPSCLSMSTILPVVLARCAVMRAIPWGRAVRPPISIMRTSRSPR